MNNLQNNVVMNLSLLKILIHIGFQNKRINYDMLEDNITTLKADKIAMKNFRQEIFNITQRIKTVEQTVEQAVEKR